MFAVTPTRTLAFAVSAALNLGLIALVMRSAADEPPVWDETVIMAELVQVRGGANNAPAPTSAQAPSSPPREPAPTTSASVPALPQPREAPAASSSAAATPAPSPAP
ncbi:hypothetical protein OUA97_22020, partial [Phenylobacterium sp. 58.2.17]|nr:hypothetical protein [Phenylobacterium sp. 58.2.17]